VGNTGYMKAIYNVLQQRQNRVALISREKKKITIDIVAKFNPEKRRVLRTLRRVSKYA